MDVKEEDKRECSDTGRSRSPPLGRPRPIGVHPGPPLSEPSQKRGRENLRKCGTVCPRRILDRIHRIEKLRMRNSMPTQNLGSIMEG